MTTVAACRTCGTEPLENARFCHGCGSPVARAHGDEARYREYRDRYRNTAKTLDFEGHIAWAEAMP